MASISSQDCDKSGDRDINDVFDDILLVEDRVYQESFKKGFNEGKGEENFEGYHLGYHRGAELGAEIGYYLGLTEFLITQSNDRIVKELASLKKDLEEFPRENDPNVDFSLLIGFANCHMVDFFTNSCYKNFIPLKIQSEVSEIGVENFAEFIFQNDFRRTPNLRNFVENSEKFTLKNSDVCMSFDEFLTQLENFGCESVDKFKLEIFMSAKKSHEVEILSFVAASISKFSQTSHIVDLGDGKGYLSSMLALNNKIPVLGVDASNINTCGASKRAKKLSKIWKNIPNNPHKSHPKKNENYTSSDVDLYRQVTEFVDESFNLQELVSDVFNLASPPKLGLVGLHTCGNLAPTSLKIFQTNDCVRSICNVGCCYHLLTENSENCGFPMSQFLTEKKLVLGRSARMIANQSVERILNSRELPNITIFYRALLQVVLAEFCEELPSKHVGKFKKAPKDFLDYARVAMKRIDVNIEITDQEIEDFYKRFKDRLDELNVFYLLRCRLSPVIESLVLLDRLLFLREQKFEKSFLVRFFDPVVSPRCYGIVALK